MKFSGLRLSPKPLQKVAKSTNVHASPVTSPSLCSPPKPLSSLPPPPPPSTQPNPLQAIEAEQRSGSGCLARLASIAAWATSKRPHLRASFHILDAGCSTASRSSPSRLLARSRPSILWSVNKPHRVPPSIPGLLSENSAKSPATWP